MVVLLHWTTKANAAWPQPETRTANPPRSNPLRAVPPEDLDRFDPAVDGVFDRNNGLVVRECRDRAAKIALAATMHDRTPATARRVVRGLMVVHALDGAAGLTGWK
jgi:hypothetical protein